MIRWTLALLVVGLMMGAAVCVAEDAKTVYTESFKKGPTKITEQTFDVSLTPEHPKPEYKVLDAQGNPRYILRFAPDIPTGDTRVVGWFVRMADLHHKIYDNILPTSQDLSRDTQQVWWLDAKPYAKTVLKTQRVFKVEQFYCVIQVKDVKRLIPDKAYVNQMDVTVQLTNTKP
ncbi:MAG TPA: hypothetical protein VNW47_01680 [Terriglobales bacterium]|nr:hypothetical protein [Terriglobales bacterium]